MRCMLVHAAPGCSSILWRCLGMGSGLVLLNNMGQLVAALGGTQGPAVYVSLFSIMNCAGRIAFGCAPIAALL